MKKNSVIILAIYLFALLLAMAGTAEAYGTTDEPIISNFQGSEPGTSVIEVIWPDGKVEKLVYKDKDVENGATSYIKWFRDRMDAYYERVGKK